ncbi:hypothetical protein CLOM_g7185 [Closterium sp. NIES-68]|nr:hypothetical protein CLOM_g7185 [Closterium sp. NIES-68]GJP78992.1 hypothetical protein CLOP_g9249 [Closterium sp. NIES-67]
MGCAVGAFSGRKAILTVLRGTSKLDIAVDISPSALLEVASQAIAAEAAMSGFPSVLRFDRPSPSGSGIFQGVTIAEGSHELFAPLARRTEATILRAERVKTLRQASEMPKPRSVIRPKQQIPKHACQQNPGTRGKPRAAQVWSPMTGCCNECDLDPLGCCRRCDCWPAYWTGSPGVLARNGQPAGKEEIRQEDITPPGISRDEFTDSEQVDGACAGGDSNEPLYRPLWVEFGHWKQRQVDELAAGGHGNEDACQEAAVG